MGQVAVATHARGADESEVKCSLARLPQIGLPLIARCHRCIFKYSITTTALPPYSTTPSAQLFDNMAAQTLSSADRIRELTEVNSDVASMLSAAGQAINALTNRPLNATNDDDNDTNMEDNSNEPATLEARKQAFQQNSTAFYNNLQAIVAKLRRQAYALEEAGIITPEAATLSTISVQAPKPPTNQPGRPPQQADQQPERITNGGMGNQDIGWLNSRGNGVGADKEKELVEDAKKLLGDVLAESRDG